MEIARALENAAPDMRWSVVASGAARRAAGARIESAAQFAGSKCIGVMLSGMGADGAHAMLELRQCGAHGS